MIPASAQTVLQGSGIIRGETHLRSTPATTVPDINSFLGANTFYSHPNQYTGTRSIVTIVDAGHLWGGANGHETLRHSTVRFDYLNQSASNPVPINPAELLDPEEPSHLVTDLGEFDFHGTFAAHAAAGRVGAANGNGGTSRQRGIAYGAQLWSGAVAIRWATGNSFAASANSILYPYTTALLTGVDVPDGNVGTVRRVADVVNSSFGYEGDPGGIDPLTVAYDGIARQSGKTLVFSAGNSGLPNTIGGPGNGYNSIVVGALTINPQTDPYNAVAGFSSRGPQRYQGPDGTVQNARARVDIVAPGQNLELGRYSGATGGNGNPPQTNYVDLFPGQTNGYASVGGTSFAAPMVAGGIGLLADVGHHQFGGGDSVHATVLKAVLLNAADKIPGWTNNTTNISGVLTTTQALDFASGAGRMNLDRAFTQYTGGVTDVPGLLGGTRLATIGWDFGVVGAGLANDYFFATSLVGNSTFAATLNWFVGREFGGVDFDGEITSANNHFINLNLEFWQVIGGVPTNLIAISSAQYLNTEHLYFSIPTTGDYMLRVRWAGERYNLDNVRSQQYGLAWFGVGAPNVAAPEPGTIVLLLLGIVFVSKRRGY